MFFQMRVFLNVKQYISFIVLDSTAGRVQSNKQNHFRYFKPRGYNTGNYLHRWRRSWDHKSEAVSNLEITRSGQPSILGLHEGGTGPPPPPPPCVGRGGTAHPGRADQRRNHLLELMLKAEAGGSASFCPLSLSNFLSCFKCRFFLFNWDTVGL